MLARIIISHNTIKSEIAILVEQDAAVAANASRFKYSTSASVLKTMRKLKIMFFLPNELF